MIIEDNNYISSYNLKKFFIPQMKKFFTKIGSEYIDTMIDFLKQYKNKEKIDNDDFYRRLNKQFKEYNIRFDGVYSFYANVILQACEEAGIITTCKYLLKLKETF